MKKPVLTSLSILCLAFVIIAVRCTEPVDAEESVIYVPTAEHPTIQEAINHANPGDTIIVSNGTYYENVAVNKSVSLKGKGPDLTIIDGGGTASVIIVKADNVAIQGFTLNNSGLGAFDNGITIDRSSGNQISSNKIVNNGNGGIGAFFSGNNIISDNVIYANTYTGIYLYRSSNNLVSGNTINSNGFAGIDVSYESYNNVIVNNDIYLNDYYGIYLSLSLNNTFYHNNIDNIDQAEGNYLNNKWDYGGEGNYWSDYKGTDLYQGIFQNEPGSDGIGDTEYVIDTNNKDHYPLMGRFSYFHVTVNKDTYQANVISTSTISDFRFEIGEETGNKIILFNMASQDGNGGFCRVDLPTRLITGPFIVLVGGEEVTPNANTLPTGAFSYLYFTHANNNESAKIISSKTLLLYNELLDQNIKLQMYLDELNATYTGLLSQYSALVGNYSQLQDGYQEFSNSYQEHLVSDSEKVDNIRYLTYIITATTAIFIATTVYLSKSTPPPSIG